MMAFLNKRLTILSDQGMDIKVMPAKLNTMEKGQITESS